MSNYVFLGPPGVGKGTLGELFSQNMGLVHISTGQLLRDEAASGSELGKQLGCLTSGGLVSDELVDAMIAKRLSQPDVLQRGCLLDGFPRTLAQADYLQKVLEDNKRDLAAAVLIDADRQLLITRLTARRVCSNKECGAIFNVQTKAPAQKGICDRCGSTLYQRSDDSEETAKKRLQVYEEQTAPLIEYYRQRQLLVTAYSEDTGVEENYRRLEETLCNAGKINRSCRARSKV
ncbi:MAG: nucleoside monophosphate kinase [Oligosphaeraceae bacterium]|nr:nucleoside monophosphate kinase [Oligosphaeraceae bacterium]